MSIGRGTVLCGAQGPRRTATEEEPSRPPVPPSGPSPAPQEDEHVTADPHLTPASRTMPVGNKEGRG